MADQLTPEEERALRQAVARANAWGWGLALGLVCGLGLMFATIILLIRGGDNVGAHLSLLGAYFPGYRVTWAGSLIGFAYAFVVGYIGGRTIATIYNRLVRR
jgi:hypothetical protein